MLDVDLDAAGKQLGAFHIPCSREDAAWSLLPIPVASVKNGTGKTVLLVGGNHGDEYEGPIALSEIAKDLNPTDVSGHVIIVPALNWPALRAGTRLSPIDGKNMNRAFPGRADGSVTDRIAHTVYAELVSRADVVVDFHSGGKSLDFLPVVVGHVLDDAALMKTTVGALEAFGAPTALLLHELDTVGLLDTAVEAQGKVFLTTELGGGARVSPQTMSIARRGAKNVLRHFGVLQDGGDIRPAMTRMLTVPDAGHYTMAKDAGLFEPQVNLGEDVREGQTLGVVHHVAWSREPEVHLARSDGTVIGMRSRAPCSPGDCLLVLGVPYT